MGRVYRARHLHLESLVAIKILGPNASNSPEAVARFRHEARAVARLKHPNIVIAHDADQEHGTPFLVLEYIEGVDLASLVKREGPRPVKEALEFVIQAAEGFEYAHSQGMIHRDIKPSNLLVDSARRIKILDLNWPPSTARSLTSRRIGRT
jgi:serine/threonine protein kinase